METLTIQFESNIKAKILEILNSFPSNELKIVNEDPVFAANKKMLDAELAKIKNGTAKLNSIDEVDEYLDKIISEYEN
ncbi:hypothetical protein [Flavobacterium sp.]|uniref:hypothetical protein n=1 Tax=Flavobacterium sp. TaxID=239 RepID=UPI00286B5D1E|nr:hypothetical protein [Flavobacterium sp.]